MRVLITGGYGFLGGRMAKFLSEITGYEVKLGVSNYSLKSSPFLNLDSIHTDWNSDESIRSACSGIDTIIHMSGMDADSCLIDPIKAFDVNAVRTRKLLSLAIDCGVSQFIYFSTIHVYGSALSGLINETTDTRSSHPYATTNLAGEREVLTQTKNGNINGIVLRLSNSYGAPINSNANCWKLLVNNLCKQATTAKKMKLTSSGLQRRDFITINDVCRATEHLMRLKFEKYDHEKRIFNIGGSWAPQVLQMAQIIQKRCKEILGFMPDLSKSEALVNEIPYSLNFSIDKLKSTNFALRNDIDGEIDSLLIYCKNIFP